VRRSRGLFLPPVAAGRVRRGDILRALKTAMFEGVLPAGARLPSSRQAAADYNVSRGVIEAVFAQLSDEGFLERRVGRGTFVASTVARVSRLTARAAGTHRPAPSRRGRTVSANAACREPSRLRPFNAGVADASEFPWRTWQRIEARAMRSLGPRMLAFADPRGLPELRESIARYLAQFRDIRCTPDEIVVFNSAQQALHALAIVLLNPGDLVALEDPCYPGAAAAFELAGGSVVPIAVDGDGMRVGDLARGARRARLVYVTPSHHYPTGAVLSLERRIALVKRMARGGGWIVEDDYDGEFGHDGQPLTPLFSLDSRRRVIYVGTLNKSLFVSLRIAFALVPRELVEPLANVRTQLDGFTSPAKQMAVSLFMEEGYFSSHLRHMRAVYRAKHAALVDALEPLRALGWRWPSNGSGMHLVLEHDDARVVRAVARASGLDLALLSAYGRLPRRGDGLFLRFGALEIAAISDGARALVEAALMTRRVR
jgi:GntR family transcriptional regulator/MocR family aminotransferase